MEWTKLIMGMPIRIEAADNVEGEEEVQAVFDYFFYVDKTFSTYKKDSEISLLNSGKVQRENLSQDVREVLKLAEDTKAETNGFFDIRTSDGIDPSGIVKGWAIYNAAQVLKTKDIHNFFIDAGGDIQTYGKNKKNEPWSIGIRNPLNQKEIVKVITVEDAGVATSGTYHRGEHIYNPHARDKAIQDIVSITVIGPNIYDADRFATAAFAMGKEGIYFIEKLKGFEGYMVYQNGIAVSTTGFERFIRKI